MKSCVIFLLCCLQISMAHAQVKPQSYAKGEVVKAVVIIEFVKIGNDYCSLTPQIIPNYDSSRKMGDKSFVFIPVARVNYDCLAYDTTIIKTNVLAAESYLNPDPTGIPFDNNAIWESFTIQKTSCYNSKATYTREGATPGSVFVAFNITAKVIRYTDGIFFIEQLGRVANDPNYPKSKCFPTSLKGWNNFYVMDVLQEISFLDDYQLKQLKLTQVNVGAICLGEE